MVDGLVRLVLVLTFRRRRTEEIRPESLVEVETL